MDAKQLDDWEALAKAATEGPWAPFPSGILHGPTWVVSNVPQGERGRIMRDEDAAFIAAARDAVPALVEEVRRLREAPPGPVTVVSGIGCDPITERAIRRAERERCIEAAGRFLTQGEEEMIAAAIRALPDAT